MIWIFFFYYLHLFLYDYILMALPITAAANWKLFAFYGKFVRNRPSKKRFCQPHRWIVSSEIVPFFLHSLAGCSYLHCGWQALGRASDEVQFWSVRLFYCPDYLLYSTLFTEDSVCPLNFFAVLQRTNKERKKRCRLLQKKDVLHVVKKNHYLIFTTMSQNQTDTILFAKIAKS